MKRSLLVLLTFFLTAMPTLADSVTVKTLGLTKPQANNTGGVVLFSLDGMRTVGFAVQPAMGMKGETWSAEVLPFADFAQAAFGSDSDAVKDYEAAAWLIEQEPRHGSSAIQMAMWALFDPAMEKTKAWDSADTAWLMRAESNSYTVGEFEGFSILVPTGCATAKCTPVELLVPMEKMPDPSAPEPASMVLVGLGLLGLGASLRRKLH